MLNGLSLFSGIGGIDKALEEWVRTSIYCELDPYCQGVLLSRMQDGSLEEAPIWPDITSLDKECLEMIFSLKIEEDSMAGKLKKMTEEQVEQAIQGYESGMSLADLGHVFGVTRQSIWDLLRRRIELRDRLELKKKNIKYTPPITRTNLRFGEENHFYRGGKRADERASKTFENEVRYGRIINPEICSECQSTERFKDGRTAIQGHHDDYNKPLEVRWLCQKCHFEWHKHHKPIAIGDPTRPSYDAKIDIITAGFP